MRRRPPRPSVPELLILKPSSLGDIIHALQVATTIKAQRDDMRISWVVREIFAPIVRACTAVDQTYVFERKGGTKGFLKLTRELRLKKFDYAFDMQGLLRTGLLMSRVHAKQKVGRSDAREGARFFCKTHVPLPPDGRRSHAIDILLQFCPVLGLKPELQGKLAFREVDSLNLRHLEGGRPGQRPVVIFPDSRREEKRWHGFKQLTELIIREPGGRRVIWAGNNYIPDGGAMPADRFLNLTGNTSLVSLPALVRRADWVISNDSGPMHLAAALQIRTFAIFGPTDPRLFGPYPLNAPTNHVIQAPLGDLRLLSVKDVLARFHRIDTVGRNRHAASR